MVDATALADAMAALTTQLGAIAASLAKIEGTLLAWSCTTSILDKGKCIGSKIGGLSVSIDNDFSWRRGGDY